MVRRKIAAARDGALGDAPDNLIRLRVRVLYAGYKGLLAPLARRVIIMCLQNGSNIHACIPPSASRSTTPISLKATSVTGVKTRTLSVSHSALNAGPRAEL